MKPRVGRNATTLKACGQLLFGEDWHAGLCRDCQLEPAKLDAILAGATEIPEQVWDDINICMSHLEALAKLKRQKKAAVQ